MAGRDYDWLFKEISRWAHQTFPESTEASKVAHLKREVEELAAEPKSGEEIIDCMMILIHLADGLGIDLYDGLLVKLAINKGRKWGTPDAEGVVEHVR